MVLSMTGYGHGEVNRDGLTISVDVQTLNGRYFDLNLRMPRGMYALESGVRQKAQDTIARGKVNISISINDGSEAPGLQVDVNRLQQYQKVFDEVRDVLNITEESRLAHYLAKPDVIKVEELDRSEEIATILGEALEIALEQLLQMRGAEGENLASDISARLLEIERVTTEVEQFADRNSEADLEKYKERIQKFTADLTLDEGRLLQEVSIQLEKRDIAEECTRLRSHITLFNEYLNDGVSAGKRLGFLLQELGREVNTIGSKSHLIEISHLVVKMKDEIEKMREQVQNIL